MISEADVEKAVDYLRASAQESAQARANVRYLEAYMKTLKAKIASAQAGLSNAAAENVALCSPEYVELLDGYRVAVEKDAFHGFKREAASALIEAWRTMQANARAEGRAYS